MLYALGRLTVMWYGGIYHGPRAPYLQLAAPHAMTLRWQTAQAETGMVYFGLQPRQWQGNVKEAHAVEEHEVRLSQLQPATRYYYAVGDAQRILYGGDAAHYFETPPLSGAASSVRAVVLGDPGDAAGTGQAQVRDSVQTWLDQHPRSHQSDFDMLLVTGDLAYTSGSNPQFQKNFFIPYQHWLATVPIWPTYGNHDARRFAFFKIFTFPSQAESGGVPSGSEHYYAFDYGQVHTVVLDSENTSLRRTGEMYQWLERDLQATRQPWLIAMFHHPPYSKGSHDSDRRRDSWGRMADMREVFLPLLEQHGVDLVLSGHSHMYERSMFLDCHYGTSDTLKPAMIVSQDPQSNYIKRGALQAPHQGAVYAVVGASAKLDDGPLNHAAMAVSRHEMGALVIDIEGMQLQGHYITKTGNITDHFTITKEPATEGRKSDLCHSPQPKV